MTVTKFHFAGGACFTAGATLVNFGQILPALAVLGACSLLLLAAQYNSSPKLPVGGSMKSMVVVFNLTLVMMSAIAFIASISGTLVPALAFGIAVGASATAAAAIPLLGKFAAPNYYHQPGR